ncbi:MAG TPA: DUF4870 domain-containing protein [Thermoanaerobaculia bacterium]|nr:DUF4870 domain-containing protein [Thermoanaerobaculia bacterium]
MSSVPPTPPPGGGSYTPPPPSPGGAPAGGSSDRTLMVVLSYLWILALIPLLTKKEDREVQWHAKHGLAILIAEVVLWIALTAVGFFIPRGMGGMGCGIGIVQCVVWCAFLVVRIMCIVKGVNGQRFRVPVISDMADKW